GPDAARKYLASRGFGGEVPKKWMLGYAPGRGALVRHLSALGFKPDEMIRANVALDGRGGPVRDRFYERVMFPIFDAQGDCVAFGGRVIGAGEPKYLNSQETPLFHKSQVLYGLDQAKARMASTGCAIVVEGYTDVIALHEAGVTNVVATLGTALTMRHIRVLAKHAPKKIVYLFDGDAAGQKAADRVLAFIGESISDKNRNSVELLAVTLPSNQDPAEFVQAEGAQALEAVVEGALPLIEFGLERRLDSFDLDTAPGRDRALDACLAVLAPIKDTLVAKDYAVRTWSRRRAHGRLGIEEADVLERLAALETPRGAPEEETGPEAPAPRPVRRALSQAERNRLRFEREFLALACQHPLVGLAHADALAQVQWHEEVHRLLAESVLATLSRTRGRAGRHRHEGDARHAPCRPRAHRRVVLPVEHPGGHRRLPGRGAGPGRCRGGHRGAHGPDERRGRRRGGRAAARGRYHLADGRGRPSRRPPSAARQLGHPPRRHLAFHPFPWGRPWPPVLSRMIVPRQGRPGSAPTKGARCSLARAGQGRPYGGSAVRP
ncbi:MAG: DNA primase, partial [Adlercreutzia sp.]